MDRTGEQSQNRQIPEIKLLHIGPLDACID